MVSPRALINSLKEIIKLLEMERSALVANDVDQISMLVDKKNQEMSKLSAFKGMDIESNKDAMALIEEINSKQELNLLLTKQALSYQNAILESMSKNLGNFSNTYSAKGKYDSSNNVSIIDQSV